MRRKDREVTEYEKMFEILRSCDCCRLGFADEGGAYIVPLNFGYEEEDGILYLYFHSAAEGKKLELMDRDPYVGFEMDGGHALVPGQAACAYSFLYQSIIGKGRIELLRDPEEKLRGFKVILSHYSNRDDLEYKRQMIDQTVVMKLTVSEWTCKEHR